MSKPKPLILPAHIQDLHHLATLEAHVFHNDPFSTVAYGPLRSSSVTISRRATSLYHPPPPSHLYTKTNQTNREKQEWKVCWKAIDEKGRLVGGAVWGFVVGRDGKEEKKEKEEWKQEDWGETANRRFCEDVFIRSDEIMIESCKGKDYAKLNSLFIDPEYQRQGIGSMLLEAGLKEVDKRGLQCVLGASKEGVELYRRFGWVDYWVMDIDLEEYGGEGMGSEEHVLMNRPARTVSL